MVAREREGRTGKKKESERCVDQALVAGKGALAFTRERTGLWCLAGPTGGNGGALGDGAKGG